MSAARKINDYNYKLNPKPQELKKNTTVIRRRGNKDTRLPLKSVMPNDMDFLFGPKVGSKSLPLE